ncbi:MAG: hypothetical protein IIZ39_02525, partial [Blautia sp.]|nr:hypothetical protein [Blautia sp.]
AGGNFTITKVSGDQSAAATAAVNKLLKSLIPPPSSPLQRREAMASFTPLNPQPLVAGMHRAKNSLA